MSPANDDSYATRQARSLPVLSSMSAVRGYPSKLKIYRIRGSRFWQVRCYMGGKMYVRSTRAVEKQHATEVAKQFYEELLVRLRQSGESEVARIDKAQQRETPAKYLFEQVAERALEGEKGRMIRGELSRPRLREVYQREIGYDSACGYASQAIEIIEAFGMAKPNSEGIYETLGA